MPRLDWYFISRRSAFVFITLALFLVGGGTSAYLYLTKAAGPADVKGDKQIAHFVSIEGNVKVKRTSTSYFVAVNRSTPLETGDTVQTDTDGQAKIQFIDGSSYSLGPDSTMVIRLHVFDTKSGTSTVNVAVGSGQVKVATSGHNESINEVQTTGASSEFDPNTKAVVAASREGDTKIDVTEGAARVTTQDGVKTRVEADERLEVASSGKIISHEKLLPSPRLAEPSDAFVIRSNGDTATVTLSWTPVSGAVRYHVAVSTSRFFTKIVAESQDVRSARLVVERMEPGRYFWQVKAFDGTGRSSVFSDPFQFTVIGKSSDGAHGIEVYLDEVTGLGPYLYEVKGRTVAGAQVRINGVKVNQVDGDGRFTALIKVTDSREIVVEAEDQSGNHGRVVRKV
ncbi:MAG TPA: FecR domain-containing protein [Blastocatellia bacterium]|nr:FecR domain-containing protein [Blastocatellia bacterium]